MRWMAAKNPTSRCKLTPPEVARRWGIAADKVIGWIRSGELQAIDASARRGGRPRYLIDVGDLKVFEQARRVQPPAHVAPRRRRRDENVIKFF